MIDKGGRSIISPLTKASILIIEDDKVHCELEKDALELAGFNVSVAETASEAYKLLEGEKLDLIVLDLMLPNVNGIQVLERIKSTHNYKNIPIVICTASGHKRDVVQCIKYGADDYILKPINIKLFLSKIEMAISKVNGDVLEDQLNELKDNKSNIMSSEIGAIESDENKNIELDNSDAKDEFAEIEEIVGIIESKNPLTQNSKISISNAMPGMTVISDITKNGIIILKAGVQLTEENIKKLKEIEIETIEVDLS